jgi:hypothetical protein
MASARFTLDVRLGDDVDICIGCAFWAPGRVEFASDDGLLLRVRVACGALEVQQVLDMRQPGDQRRLAAGGSRSVPLLHGQAVDVLRRVSDDSAAVAGSASEQWQRGEVQAPAGSADASRGGDRPVTVKITSTGDALLGVTYGAGARPSRHSAGASVAGVLATAAVAGSHAPALSGGVVHASAADRMLVLAEPSLLAPAGQFGKWVPTLADIASCGPEDGPPGLRSIGVRCRAFLRDSAATTAALHAGGRAVLDEYELVDVLPPARRRGEVWALAAAMLAQEGQAGAEAARPVAGAGTGPDGRRGRASLAAEMVPGSPVPRRRSSVSGSGSLGAAVGATSSGPGARVPAQTWYLARIHRDAATGALQAWYFEPSLSAEGLLVPRVRVEPVGRLRGVAPPGSHTLPYVPGMPVDARRMGGVWARGAWRWSARKLGFAAMPRR